MKHDSEIQPARWNDALLLGQGGPEWEALLDRPMAFALAPSIDAKTWTTRTAPLRAWLEGTPESRPIKHGRVTRVDESGLTRHPISPTKDGQAVCFAALAGAQRHVNAVTAVDALALDLDGGDALEEVVERVVRFGRAAVIYTTHSHGGDTTDLPRDKVLGALRIKVDPTVEQVQDYLRHHDPKGRTDEFIRSVTIDDARVVTPQGQMIRLRHMPVAKMRVFFPLAETTQMTTLGATQVEGRQAFEARVLGLGVELLGVAPDTAALDASRAFYLPRHKVGAEFYAAVVQGPPLRWDEIPPVSKRDYRDARKGAAGASVQKDRPVTPGGLDLVAWAAQGFAARFEVARLLADHDKARGGSEEKITSVCPFDAEHSNAGDGQDKGCYAVSGDGDRGFTWACAHTSCKDRHDRLDMLAKALADGWFEEATLVEEEAGYLVPDEDAEEVVEVSPPDRGTPTAAVAASVGVKVQPKAPQADGEVIESREDDLPPTEADDMPAAAERLLSKATTGKTLSEHFAHLLDADVDEVVINTWEGEVAARTSFGRRKLAPIVKEARKENRAKAQKAPQDGKRLSRSSDAALDQVAYAESLIAEGTGRTGQPVIYALGNGLVTLSADPGSPPEAVDVTPAALTAFLTRRGSFREGTDGSTAVQAPLWLALHVLNEPDAEIKAARLERIATTPVFAADGRLVVEPGWDEASHIFYAPTKDLNVGDVPEAPTEEEAHEAGRLLVDIFGDFPFRGGMTRARLEAGEACPELANLIAWMVTPVARDLMGPEAVAPGLLVSKPTQGSGASKALMIAQLILSGVTDLRPAFPKREEEQNKEIIAALRSNKTYLAFDDVEELGGKPLSLLLTSPNYSGRTLSQSETRSYPNRLSIAATGNNPTFSKDLRRRFIGCRIEPTMAQPGLRPLDAYKYPRLEEFVRKNRGQLYRALLIPVQRWVSLGRPSFAGVPSMASYEEWAETVGAILELAGIQGFLRNRGLMEEEVADASDTEDGAQVFVEGWVAAATAKGTRAQPSIGLEKVLAKDLIQLCMDRQIDVGLDPRYGGAGDQDYAPKAFGRWLARQHQRRFTVDGVTWQFVREPERTAGGHAWSVRPV